MPAEHALLLSQVQLQFNMLAEATPQWVRVDASGSVEQVASRVRLAVMQY